MEQDLHCQSCGRPFGQESHCLSDNVKYCSKKCRLEKLNKKDQLLDNFIIDRLKELSSTNICPSQISREYFRDDWRAYHQRTVKSCRRLFLLKKINITQKKKVISSLNFKGPFRISIK